MVEKAAMEGNVGESENWVHLFSRGEIFRLSSEAASLWKYLKVLELKKEQQRRVGTGAPHTKERLS